MSDVLEEEQGTDRKFVSALARGLEVLRCFRPGEASLSNNDISERTGLPKPTVTRLTHTLRKLGYLVYSEKTGNYQLGSGVLSLGYGVLSGIGNACARRRVHGRPVRRTQSACHDCSDGTP